MQEEVAEYTLIRSSRKTVSLQVKENGEIIVRAPFGIPERKIRNFVDKNRDWVKRRLEEVQEQRSRAHVITDKEREEGVKKALKVIPERVAYYAARMGVTYHRITIREQKTRWGSCSKAGNLNFNWKLVLMPPEILDYVVVHELAHRKQMNHSPAFWAEVAKEIPDYQNRRKTLNELGKQWI